MSTVSKLLKANCVSSHCVNIELRLIALLTNITILPHRFTDALMSQDVSTSTKHWPRWQGGAFQRMAAVSKLSVLE